MGILLKLVGYLSFITATALAFPEFRSPKLLLQEADEYCRLVALNNLLNSNKLPGSTDFRSGMRMNSLQSEGIGVDNREAIKLVLSNIFDTDKDSVFGEKKINGNGVEQDLLGNEIDQDILNTFSQLHRACTQRITPEPSVESKDTLNSRLATILRKAIGGPEVKRAKLGLNPTGWRKRRSSPEDEERMRELMQNMKEIMVKRQRLEFNPTGW